MKINYLRYFWKVPASLMVLMIILSGCDFLYSEKASKEQADLAKNFAPDSSNGVIYIFRAEALEIPRAVFIYNDGSTVASLKVGSFVRLVVSPGAHIIGTKSPSARSLQDRLTIVAEAGKLYYAEVGYKSGGVTGDSPKLSQVDEGTAQELIRGYQLLVTGPIK